MKESLDRLTDEQANSAIKLVAESWLSGRGVEAYAVMQLTYHEAQARGLELPDWARRNNSNTTEGDAELCRTLLKAIVEGRDPEARRWVRQAISDVERFQAQAVDPLTLAIGGTILIGLVLASRVKKIDGSGVEFEKGLPDGLVDLVDAASGFLKGIS